MPMLVSGAEEGTCIIRKLSDKTNIATFDYDAFSLAIWKRDGKNFLAIGGVKTIDLWDLESYSFITQLHCSVYGISYSVVYYRDEKPNLVATGENENTMLVWFLTDSWS